MSKPEETPEKDNQSLYPADTPRKNWTAVIVTIVIIVAGILAFYYMEA